jgi:tetratricopeptide (TPR) repeat protein
VVTALLAGPPLTTVLPGYARDLAALRHRRAQREVAGAPDGPTAVSELLTLRHREVMLTGGRPEELLSLGGAVDSAVERFPSWPDLRLLRATVALAVHRPDDAATALAAVPEVVEQPAGQVLAADVAQFRGGYATALAGYRRAARQDPRWDTTARLAALAVATGRCDEADDLYAAAEEEITAKQMRAFAWVLVQRGELALAVGDPDRARRCYDDADRGYPGWWYVTAHRAALDAALDRHVAAAAGAREVLAQVDRPEFREAHGSVLAACGEAAAAAECHATALAVYLASAARGEVHYLHHLATFYADVRPDSRAALAYARQDVALRRTGATLSLLAWCLYRAGRIEEARAAVDEAAALGARDPRHRARAAEIRRAAGDLR